MKLVLLLLLGLALVVVVLLSRRALLVLLGWLRGRLERLGFNTRVPATWNTTWVLMWAALSALLLIAAFQVLFRTWLVLAVLFFGIPEVVGISVKKDALPPLTHCIRHFLPNFAAFPLIYGLLGAIGAKWLQFPHPWHVGGLFALLGWLTDHFEVTYLDPDPGNSELTPQAQEAIDRNREPA